MKEVLSLATFALGVLCFVAFVTTVKPTAISAIQAAPNYCRTDSSGMVGCDLHVFAAPEAIRSNHPMNSIETPNYQIRFLITGWRNRI